MDKNKEVSSGKEGTGHAKRGMGRKEVWQQCGMAARAKNKGVQSCPSTWGGRAKVLENFSRL